MTLELVLAYIVAFLYGIVIGSFLNVCIYRIPKKESIAKEHSHCMSCGYRLKWFDLVPLFSWIFLKGRCRKCKTKLSAQYPLVEGANGILYVVIFFVNGLSFESVLYCLFVSALLVLAVIDFRTYEIPFGINVFILMLGLIHTIYDHHNWLSYVIGLLAISIPLELLLLASKGRAIGGGDVKLMAAAGLLLGWQKIILAFVLGCILGSVIHIIRMRVSHAERVLAMGPYLSLGLFLTLLWGSDFLAWYLGYLK